MEAQSRGYFTYVKAEAELDFGDGPVWLEIDIDGYVLRQMALIADTWYWADSKGSSSELFTLADQPQQLSDIPGYEVIHRDDFELIWKKLIHDPLSER
jgi:hypothetical protein